MFHVIDDAQVHFFLPGPAHGDGHGHGGDAEDPGHSYETVRSDFEAAVNVGGCVCVCVWFWVGVGVGVGVWGCGGGWAGRLNTTHRRHDTNTTHTQVIDKIYPKIMVNCLLVRGRFSPVRERDGVVGLWVCGWRRRDSPRSHPTPRHITPHHTTGGAGAAVVRDGRAQAPHVHGLPLQPCRFPPLLGRAHHHALKLKGEGVL